MKVFWIGEESEMYAGSSIEEIVTSTGFTYTKQDVEDGRYGEVTDLSTVVQDCEDDNITYTLAEMIDGASGVLQLTSQYA